MSNFLITSYYTLDTPYHEISHQFLIPSIERLGLKSDIRAIQNLGSWQRNTAYKSLFVLQMLIRHKSNIVFLDSDAVVTQYPKLFDEIPDEFYFACHLLDRNAWYGRNHIPQFELLSGTAFFRYHPKTLELVSKWIELCEQDLYTWEQELLQKAISSLGIQIYNLPLTYCYIKTLPDGSEPIVKVEKPVIVHYQASRKFKNNL